MHQNIIFLGDDNFIKTFEELKSFFEFKYHLQNIKDLKEVNNNSLYILLLQDFKKIKFVNENNVIIFKTKGEINNKCASVTVPCDIFELRNQINKNLISKKFQLNTKIKVRDYLLDINSRLLIKNNIQLKLTEKESKLIEFLNQKQSPITKEQLIQHIWNYSTQTETHTLETHIYRLRKKISDKFNDDSFILINDHGYYI